MDSVDLIWKNGEFLPWEDAQTHVLSHGLHYGTGVFEGIRCYDTPRGPAIFRHHDHLDRLEKSAALYYMDRDYLEYNTWFELELPKMPSQYMKDHAIYGMVREPLAVKIGQELPNDMPLELFWWGSDFPHSRKYIEETFADLSPELRHTLLLGNAAKHLHLDLDADITETPAA